MTYGAQSQEWAHFDLVLGLSADLLPVVSNPSARIHPDSKLKEIGKTPSRYAKDGRVVGLPGWSRLKANGKEMAAWSAQADYGICVQTRSVRALDIDVPDPQASQAIVRFVADHLQRGLPQRRRANSGKALLAFHLPGEMAKRRMPVEGGLIEFLATGQQFVAVGTHPSGVRYEWVGGLPDEIPELTLEQFEALWAALTERFAQGEVASTSVSVRKRGEHVALPDPVADLLKAQGKVLDRDRDGALLIECPWSAEHTAGEAGDGSTCWFPAGTNGYERGHFKCLHGHCAGRSDGDFFAAVGYVEDVSPDFDVVPVPAGKADRAPLPAFRRDTYGRIEATIGNVHLALARPDLCGMQIRLDRFRDEIMWAAPGTDQWAALSDADYSRLRITLEAGGFKAIGRELMRDAVLLMADEHPFDSAITWLEQLEWDGIARCERFLHTHFGAQDSDYVEAVSAYLWSALAGRVLRPGIKADMVPILIGEQGTGKSSGVAAMVPSQEFFTEVSFHEKEDDLSRKMRGRLLGEIGELRGLHTKELESIKAFITRTHETWVPKYREFATTFPRRIVLVGSTNQEEFLSDPTGNRRFLPLRVSRVDVAAIARDCLQLWAEARVLFQAGGVAYAQAERLAQANQVHEAHMMSDAWAEPIARWLDEPGALTGEIPRARDYLRTSEVLKGALNLDDKHIGRREEMRVSAVLKALGYERKRMRINGGRDWVFALPGPT